MWWNFILFCMKKHTLNIIHFYAEYKEEWNSSQIHPSQIYTLIVGNSTFMSWMDEKQAPWVPQWSDHVHKVRTLSDGVNHYHNSVFSFRFWQFDYKIHTDCIPWGIGDGKWVQFSDRGLMASFGAEAHITDRNIPADVPWHLRPPLVLGNQF